MQLKLQYQVKNKWQISLCQQRQNCFLALFWLGASSSRYENFSSHNMTVLQHPRLWWKIWCDIYLECLSRLTLTEWDFPLWSPAALSVLSPHSYLCQPAEKLSISLSLSSPYSVAQWFASYWGLATLCEEQTPHSITSHRQQTKANSTNTHSQ